MFKRKPKTKSDFEKYNERYIQIQVRKLEILAEELDGVKPESKDYDNIMNVIAKVQCDLDEALKRVPKEVSEKGGFKLKLTSETITLLSTIIGTGGTLLATSMIINNERDGNMLPAWSRSLTDKSLKGK